LVAPGNPTESFDERRASGMAYAVKEIYFTLQGEGAHTRFMSLFRTVRE
jgi:hypothetical protein